MVYILDENGNPLMPTERHGKVRRLLKEGKAEVVNTLPFTVKLLYNSQKFVQDITLGIDSGSKFVGISATNADKEFYSSIHKLRDGKNSVHELMETRKTLRRSRRNRKTRYRQARFDNRVPKPVENYSKVFMPTIRNKIAGHEHMIREVEKILPISHIVVECAAFDTQLLKNPNISGVQYQQGEMCDWEANLREYVLFRDHYQCQWCKKYGVPHTVKLPDGKIVTKKSDGKILQVHHIQFRSRGGSDRPGNLITLCTDCHEKLHKIEKETGVLPIDFTKSPSLKHAASTSTMKWELYNMVKRYDENASMTFGYKTKKTRIDANRNLNLNLRKDHNIDARCITGNPAAKPLGYTFISEQRRCHNRALFDAVPVSIPKKVSKEGLIKNNSYFRPSKIYLDYFGFRDGDIVKIGNDLYMVTQRMSRNSSVELGLKPWNGSKGTVKYASSNKVELISRNPNRINIRKDTEINNKPDYYYESTLS